MQNQQQDYSIYYSNNKMYINPRFNVTTNNGPTIMHVNPNFCHPNVTIQEISTKIHVNPKFMNTTPNPLLVTTQLNKNSCDIGTSNTKVDSLATPSTSTVVQQPIVVSKSRYNIVRNNNSNKTTISHNGDNLNLTPKHQKRTVPINKYKTVHISDMKQSLKKPIIKTNNVINKGESCINKNKYKIMKTNNLPMEIYKNKYKLIKLSSSTNPLTKTSTLIKSTYKFIRGDNKTVLPTATTVAKKSRFKYIKSDNSNLCNKNHDNTPIKNKYNIKNNSMSSMNHDCNTVIRKPKVSKKSVVHEKSKLKKNNIPCPLFRKYGKCIRQLNGKCDFLHDKKHVTICRKFIKGLCHDSSCLLSHDLTMKKMPQCYFYLKGICTKTNCPYLHVKLNEKATVCANFLKGYCESGDNCLKRHVNMCLDELHTGKCMKKHCPHPHKTMRKRMIGVNKNEHNSISNVTPEIVNSRVVNDTKVCENLDVELSRYYNKQAEDTDTCEQLSEVIKPTRCKLGTLPSFIKL